MFLNNKTCCTSPHFNFIFFILLTGKSTYWRCKVTLRNVRDLSAQYGQGEGVILSLMHNTTHSTSCHVMISCVMLCYVVLCCVMLCYVMLWYGMSCYVMLCYVMLWYVMSCYVMLCYVMLCCVISRDAIRCCFIFQSTWHQLVMISSIFFDIYLQRDSPHPHEISLSIGLMQGKK
jgi:hypothetical protein